MCNGHPSTIPVLVHCFVIVQITGSSAGVTNFAYVLRRISGVISAIFVVFWAEICLISANICLTSGWSAGSSTTASWCVSSTGALVLEDWLRWAKYKANWKGSASILPHSSWCFATESNSGEGFNQILSSGSSMWLISGQIPLVKISGKMWYYSNCRERCITQKPLWMLSPLPWSLRTA